jgi:dTDP-4-dehydrorhamnose 3,5-epimerase
VELSGENRNAVFVSEGLGHMFLSLEDNTVVTYLVSDIFKPDREHAINPFDPVLGIEFPLSVVDLKISDKDLAAPGLLEARDRGLLPLWEDR